MAAFNFPNSPSVNDLHTENGVTFKWNGTMWNGGSSVQYHGNHWQQFCGYLLG